MTATVNAWHTRVAALNTGSADLGDGFTLQGEHIHCALTIGLSWRCSALNETNALCKPPPELYHVACLNNSGSGNASSYADRA